MTDARPQAVIAPGPKFKRVMLKISGEALMGPGGAGRAPPAGGRRRPPGGAPREVCASRSTAPQLTARTPHASRL
jgi:hypothetical protein